MFVSKNRNFEINIKRQLISTEMIIFKIQFVCFKSFLSVSSFPIKQNKKQFIKIGMNDKRKIKNGKQEFMCIRLLMYKYVFSAGFIRCRLKNSMIVLYFIDG